MGELPLAVVVLTFPFPFFPSSSVITNFSEKPQTVGVMAIQNIPTDLGFFC